MNRKAKHHRKSGKALTIILTIAAVVMTAIVVFIGLNGWDVDKSLKQFGIGKEEAAEEPAKEPEAEEPGLEEEEPAATDEPADENPVLEDPDTGKEEPVKQEPEQTAPDEKDPAKEPAKEPVKEPAKEPVKEPVKEPAKPAQPQKPGNKPETPAKKPGTKTDNGYIEGQQLPAKPTYIQGILVANKKYPLPSTFAPGENKEARAAFDKMAAEAKLSGFDLTAFSTYRSYDYQVTLYDRYVKKDGKDAADRYSAQPGYSEHQTGLAFDIGEVNHEKHWASSSFGGTEAGKWLSENAHRYGFILRYPKGKESVTGYMHEAWHYRYVGEKVATAIHERNITLEEYLGIHQ